jgi:hypothetical protein
MLQQLACAQKLGYNWIAHRLLYDVHVLAVSSALQKSLVLVDSLKLTESL